MMHKVLKYLFSYGFISCDTTEELELKSESERARKGGERVKNEV